MSIWKAVPLFGAVLLGTIVTVYTGVSNGNQIIVFNFEGSASMKPIMEYLLNKYASQQKTKAVTFNISTIGSNAGLKKMLDGTSDFALVSHDISHLPKDANYTSKWKEKQLKTITLATETMAVLYKPPAGCDKELTLSETNIRKFYSVFSGFKDPSQSESIGFNDLLDEKDDKCKTTIHAWVKSTGPVKSGTAKAFIDNPLFTKSCKINGGQCSNDCDQWCKKVMGGYGTDYELNYAPEPTSLHWDSFKRNIKDGSMTYLPSNFVFQNWDEISSLGIKLAKYKKQSDSQIIAFAKDAVDTTHEWVRSYNLVYSTKDISTKRTDHKSLLEFLVVNSKCLKELKLSAKSYSLASSSGSSPESICSTSADSSESIDLNTQDDTGSGSST